MTVTRYLLGCLELAVMVLPLGWATVRMRRRFWEPLAGAPALLADVVVVVAWLQLVTLSLGTVGALRPGWMMLSCAVTGATAALALGSGRAAARGSEVRPGGVVLGVGAPAACAVSLVTGGQAPPTLAALAGGVPDFDSLQYHLPAAARWVQEGSVTNLHHLYPDSLMAYYPGGAELLHAVGMLAFGADILSPVLNLFFVGIVLLAVWCIGTRHSAGPAALGAATLVMAAQIAARNGGGTALNDVPAVAFLLVAVALAAHPPAGGSARLPVIGLAAGLAIGVKALAIVPALVFVAVVLAAERRRSGPALAALVAGGGYWYVRNLIAIGTPMPGLDFSPLAGPAATNTPGTSFASAWSNGRQPLELLAGALSEELGKLWMVALLVSLAGLTSSVLPGRPPWERAAGLAGLASLAVWPFVPYTELVWFNIRYALFGLVIGPVLLALRLGPWAPRASAWTMVALGSLTALQVDGLESGYRLHALAAGVLVAAAVAVRAPMRAGLAVVALGIALGAPLADRFLARRYTPATFAYGGPAGDVVRPLAAWGRRLSGERIGIEGGEIQYPLYGNDLSNHVQYVGRTQPDGGFKRTRSCREWKRAVVDGRYRYLVLMPFGRITQSRPQDSPHLEWTIADPAARVVMRPAHGVTIVRLDGRLDPRRCA